MYAHALILLNENSPMPHRHRSEPRPPGAVQNAKRTQTVRQRVQREMTKRTQRRRSDRSRWSRLRFAERVWVRFVILARPRNGRAGNGFRDRRRWVRFVISFRALTAPGGRGSVCFAEQALGSFRVFRAIRRWQESSAASGPSSIRQEQRAGDGRAYVMDIIAERSLGFKAKRKKGPSRISPMAPSYRATF